MRARQLSYDPHKQVLARLRAFTAMGHPTDKVELIIMGGTFLAYPIEYQYEFVKRCYDALNGKESKDLDMAKNINETTEHRSVALCIETRPDFCGPDEIKRMLDFGATRCELGVQIVDDEIYKKTKRGHTVADVKTATRLLKEAGFKVGYHLMPGLPGSSMKKDIERFKEIFDSEDFRPDQIKLYPTQVMKNSELENQYNAGKYEPYSDSELVDLLIKLKSLVPKWCRVMRVMREIPPSYLVAGTKRIDLRNVVLEKMQKNGLHCQCIRCREVGFALRHGRITKEELASSDVKLNKIEYPASGGTEVFLSFENPKEIIFGLCRLRVDGSKTALIRELHVFGPEVKLGAESERVQHKGLGTALMKEAERIATEHGCDKIKVISGVGVREYYKNLGYELDNEQYMSKGIG
jgi:elongator complex protein 3